MLASSSRFVLVADDDEDDRLLLQLAFNEQGLTHQLRFVDDGLALLEELGQRTLAPALIILDLNMPRLNGFETLQVLRHNSRYSQTPIVILSTSDRIDDRRDALALGANAFMTKPLQVDALGLLVAQLHATWLSD